jgi:hypothetical protein
VVFSDWSWGCDPGVATPGSRRQGARAGIGLATDVIMGP